MSDCPRLNTIDEPSADQEGCRSQSFPGGFVIACAPLPPGAEIVIRGKRIVFIDPDGISMVDQGGAIRRLVKGSSSGYEFENAAVSPDGTRLAFYDDSKDKGQASRRERT